MTSRFAIPESGHHHDYPDQAVYLALTGRDMRQEKWYEGAPHQLLLTIDLHRPNTRGAVVRMVTRMQEILGAHGSDGIGGYYLFDVKAVNEAKDNPELLRTALDSLIDAAFRE
jgi:hypothetical protein